MLAIAWSAPARAESVILLKETWSTGTIDPAVWLVTDPEVIALEDLGGGDHALALRGSMESGAALWWGDHIYSVGTFDRGERLRCTFRVWQKARTNVQGGFHGPWHFDDTSPVYSNQEACIDFLYSDFRRGEGGPVPIQSGPSLSNFTSAFASANSKATSLLVRVELGDERGMKIGFSTNNGLTYATATNGDTLDTGVGQTLDGLHLGFGPHALQAGTVLIDDIVVERGGDPSGVPELPADIRDLSVFFGSGEEGFKHWQFIPESNVGSLSSTLHPGRLQVFLANQGQDIRGIPGKAIPVTQYPLPWEFQLGMEQAFNVTTGRSSNQINTAAGLRVALTFSNPASWPDDRTQMPPNTHTFDLLGVHLGNYGEVGSGLPQLVGNPNLLRPPGDNSPEAYLVYGRGGPWTGSASGDWRIPYIAIGDGAKYGGPASTHLYYRFVLVSPTQIQVGVKFDASHGWNMRTINTGALGQITGVWEIGPIISGDNWIPQTLAPALGIGGSPPVAVPDPTFEYYLDHMAFLQGVPVPFTHYSDEFSHPGWMGQWQIQEQNTLVETWSRPGWLTLTLTGSGAATGFGPVSAAPIDLSVYPPPWEAEIRYLPPDDTIPWNFYYALVARGSNPINFVIFLPGVQSEPAQNKLRFMTGVGGDSPFQPVWPGGEVPQEILSAKPLSMIFQMIDNQTLRIGFKAEETDPWFFSEPFNTSAAMPGGSIARWELGVWSTTTSVLGGGFGGPAWQRFQVDYVRYRESLTVNESQTDQWGVY